MEFTPLDTKYTLKGYESRRMKKISLHRMQALLETDEVYAGEQLDQNLVGRIQIVNELMEHIPLEEWMMKDWSQRGLGCSIVTKIRKSYHDYAQQVMEFTPLDTKYTLKGYESRRMKKISLHRMQALLEMDEVYAVYECHGYAMSDKGDHEIFTVSIDSGHPKLDQLFTRYDSVFRFLRLLQGRHGGGGDQGSLLPQSMRLDVTRFIGIDIESWLFSINEYFSFLNTPVDQHLRIVRLNLEGAVIECFCKMTWNGLITDWDRHLGKRECVERIPSVTVFILPRRSVIKTPVLPTPPKAIFNLNGKPLVIKWISLVERQERLSKGLCFNCDNQWTRWHKLPGKFLLLMTNNDEDTGPRCGLGCSMVTKLGKVTHNHAQQKISLHRMQALLETDEVYDVYECYGFTMSDKGDHEISTVSTNSGHPELDQLLARYDSVFQEHQFYMKHSKCVFGVREVEYLGHIISARGVEIAVKGIESKLKVLLLREFHDTPSVGHGGIKKTLVGLSTLFFWKGMLWEDVSIDFLTRLLVFKGNTVIIIVVDRLKKVVSPSSKFIGTFVEDLNAHGSKKINSKASTLIFSQPPRQWMSLVELCGPEVVSPSSKFIGTFAEDLNAHGSKKINSKASTLIFSQPPRQRMSLVELCGPEFTNGG
nr:prolyl oligopeptidase family protein [Tanacetum cinerariifolium]